MGVDHGSGVAQRNPIARSAIARVVVLIPTAIATLVTSRLIIGEFGVTSFNSYSLILALIALLPLNNLGVSRS